jgi:CheY-like chemotaxis protein
MPLKPQGTPPALELAAQEPSDVLIADIGLPDKTGYELMKQICKRLQAGA